MARQKKTMVLLGGLVALAVAALLVRTAFTSPHNQCLTGDDYRNLTGYAMPATTDSKTSFHAYTLAFEGNSAITTTEQSVVNKVAKFYTAHRHKSILFDLEGVNQDPTTGSVATARLQTLTDKLTRAGVDSTAISSGDPQFYELDSNNGGIVTLTITTGVECKQ